MGHYATYFGGDVWEGVLPADFTERYDEPFPNPGQLRDASGLGTPATYGRLAFYFDDNGGETLYSWDRMSTLGDDTTDLDMLCLYYVEAAASIDNMATLWARASGGINTEVGYTCDIRDSLGTITFRINEYTAGSASTVTSTSVPFAIQTWYYMQFRLQGSSLKARHWEAGTAPPNWQLEATDSTHTADGWCGIGNTGQSEIYFDYLSVATQGDAAELPFELIAPGNDNVITAYPAEVATDASSFLVYTGEPNVAVDWNLTGDGTLSVITDVTDASGRAWAKYTPGTLGTKTVDVTVGVPA
jgi:hypothetical protein